ncbi:hypothetical protein Cni_G25165 [Canna indica]|uniref:RIN4 pathogenic type III effector avirulence factor Avr cleavage site domain-containing protein n=1 Tax=Canna indica TaxID=4628 RepID=A0AAQ3QNZ4_9LILI|nr:hypothetical protein Cni_G25165 [Canna indica]
MEKRSEKRNWISVPQFGGWDKKNSALDYSMVFSRVRSNRKKHMNELRPCSLFKNDSLDKKEKKKCITYQQREKNQPPLVLICSMLKTETYYRSDL